MKLSEVKTGAIYEIISTPNFPILKGLGIVAGQKIYLKYRYPFSGPVVIRLFRRYLALGRSAAKRIEVKEHAP